MNPDTPNQIRKMMGTWALRYQITGADLEALAAERAKPRERRRIGSPTQDALRAFCEQRPGLGQPAICAALGITDKAFYSASSKLTRSSRLYSVLCSDGRSRAYFASAEARDAWVREHGIAIGDTTAIVPPQRLAVFRAAEAKGATGITAMDLVRERGMKRNLAHHHLSGLVESGLLHASKHQGYSIRYFAELAGAQAHTPCEADRIVTGRAAEKRRKEGAGLRVFRPKGMPAAKPGAAAPVRIAAPMLVDGPADTSRAKVTRIDSPPNSRWQCAPDLPPDPRYPSFASQPLGSSLARTE